MPPSSEPPSTAAAASFAEGLGCANPVFDESGHFVAYTTLTGIKVRFFFYCCCSLNPLQAHLHSCICTLRGCFLYFFVLFASHFPFAL